MQRTLVVPLDGSDLPAQALPYAVRLAKARAARLVLRVAPTGTAWDGQPSDEVDRSQTYLSGVSEGLVSPGISIETLCPLGDPAEQILKIVDQFDADEIVMSTHGRTGFAHLLYGSVAEAVVARSPVPVLLVGTRAGTIAMPAFDPAAPRVLLALDGSDFAQSALPAALELAGLGGELILCRVVPAPITVVESPDGSMVYADEPEPSELQLAHDELETIAGRLRQTHPERAVSVEVRIGEPARGIVTAVTTRMATVVVMTSHARTGLGRAVLGSVAGTVVRTATVPVLVIRPTADDTALTPMDSPGVAAIY
jgi:nucleotide-binding universal stress UspA family protein